MVLPEGTVSPIWSLPSAVGLFPDRLQALYPPGLQADLLPLTGKSKVNDEDRLRMGQECSYNERQHLQSGCVCVRVLGEGLPYAPKSFHL